MLPGQKFRQKHLRERTFKHGLDGKCKSCISAPSFGTVEHGKFRPSVFPIHENRELRSPTFLSHGRQPKVNMSHARKVVSHISNLIVSTREKTINNMNMVV